MHDNTHAGSVTVGVTVAAGKPLQNRLVTLEEIGAIMKPHNGAVLGAIMALAAVCAGADSEQRPGRCMTTILRPVDLLNATFGIVILKMFVWEALTYWKTIGIIFRVIFRKMIRFRGPLNRPQA